MHPSIILNLVIHHQNWHATVALPVVSAKHIPSVLMMCWGYVTALSCSAQGKRGVGSMERQMVRREKGLNPNVTYGPCAYVSLAAAHCISWPLLLRWPLDLHTRHTNWNALFFFFFSIILFPATDAISLYSAYVCLKFGGKVQLAAD